MKYTISQIAVYGLYYFGKGHLSLDNYARFVRYDSLAQVYLSTWLNKV